MYRNRLVALWNSPTYVDLIARLLCKGMQLKWIYVDL